MDHKDVMYAYQAQKENKPAGENFFARIKNYFNQNFYRSKRLIQSLSHHPRRYLKRAVFGFIIIMILIPILTYLFFARDIYDKNRLMNRNNTGITLLDRTGKPFFAFYQPKNRTTIPLSQIPDSTQHAVVAIEDKNFYSEPGFSIRGIGRAIFTDIETQGLRQGGSTITQQLVKNLLLNSVRSPIRKYQEIVLAIEIDRVYSKNDILEMYLNSVYFGEGAFGIQDASQTYFGKDAKNLSLAESALLAGLLQAPSATSPLSNDPNLAKQRQEVILDQMKQQGYITQSQATQAQSQKLVYTPKKEEDINVVAPHFALMVKDFLAQKFGGEDAIARSGMKVQTTLDLSDQKYAETAVLNQVNVLKRNKVSNGAVVALDPRNGEVLVLVGSKDWADPDVGKFNIATALRQPGSAMKPIVYGAALEKKLITPATILEDKPTDFGGGYKPKNYDGKYRGEVTVRRALSNSLNIPAVEVLQRLGVQSAVSKARQMGIITLGDPNQYGLSLVLGAGDVQLIQLTQAYGVFATYGRLHDLNLVQQVWDKNGQIIYKESDNSKGVMDPEPAFLISSILSDDNARAEEFDGALTVAHHAAVKTGTTDSFRDAWTVGYTPSIVVGSWVGNNDNTPMDNIAGALGAAPIWRQVIEKVLAGTPAQKFNPVGSIVEEDLCLAGALAPQSSPSVPSSLNAATGRIHEYFIAGTEPPACPTPAPSPTPTPSINPSVQPSESPLPTPQQSQPSAPPSSPPVQTPAPILTPIPSLFPSVSPNT